MASFITVVVVFVMSIPTLAAELDDTADFDAAGGDFRCDGGYQKASWTADYTGQTFAAKAYYPDYGGSGIDIPETMAIEGRFTTFDGPDGKVHFDFEVEKFKVRGINIEYEGWRQSQHYGSVDFVRQTLQNIVSNRGGIIRSLFYTGVNYNAIYSATRGVNPNLQGNRVRVKGTVGKIKMGRCGPGVVGALSSAGITVLDTSNNVLRHANEIDPYNNDYDLPWLTWTQDTVHWGANAVSQGIENWKYHGPFQVYYRVVDPISDFFWKNSFGHVESWRDRQFDWILGGIRSRSARFVVNRRWKQQGRGRFDAGRVYVPLTFGTPASGTHHLEGRPLLY